jgi:1,4-dihydroxy-2-naphthoate octaprenyltransferase
MTLLAPTHAPAQAAPTGRAPAHGANRAIAWVRLLRLQFYPLSAATYALGALQARQSGARLAAAALAWGYGVVLLLQAVTVIANELLDIEADARNERFGFFNGGSRVLVDRALSAETVRRGLVALTLGLLALAPVGAFGLTPRPPVTLALVVVGAALGYGYTVPPARLCYRGLGELTVAFMYSYYLFTLGYFLQRGALPLPGEATPYCLPLLLAILPAIVIANVPDAPSDASLAKWTWPALLGTRRAVLLALTLATAACAAWCGLWSRRLVEPAVAVATTLIACHLLGHLAYAWRRWDRITRDLSTTTLLVSSLAYIVWFAVSPLIVRLWM